MSIKLFTHTDFDGVGCGVLGKLAFDNIDIEYCDYIDVNKKVYNFIKNKEYLNYNHVYITDISINKELAKFIDDTQPKEFNKGFTLAEHFSLIDHHPTAMQLNEYWWCFVEVEDEKGKCSGTSLFYQYLDKDRLKKDNIIEFVEIVRQYDTWEWNTIYNNEVPKKWNDLLYLYGKKRFTEKIVKMLESKNNLDFTKIDLLLLELEKEKKERYFETKEKEMIEKNIQGYHVGIVFAEQHRSELGNYLANKYNKLDFIILIGSQSISYRGIRDNIDLGLFAKQFGGGGHPKASGSQIDREKQKKYIEILFQL